jgi:tRNA-dihydrouridine synthase B
VKINSIHIDKPIALAPMEDVTGVAFRLVCKRMGADIVYTEFVNSEGLIRENARTMKKMDFQEEERPFGIQIYGHVEGSMEKAAAMAESYGPDIIDINCGCWVKDIAMRGAGAGLLRDLPRMESIIARVVRNVNTPVTVKTRLGWDSESIKIVDVAKMVENVGAKALTIHCRTRAQGHKGEPDFSWIPRVKQAVSIPIFVNGGLDTPEKIERAFAETGCDGVMIGQAAINNPWIFRQARYYLQHKQLLPAPDLDERVRVLLEHLRLSVEQKGEQRAVLEFRKHYTGYLRDLPNVAKIRSELMHFTEMSPIVDHIYRYVSRLKSAEAIPAQL